MLDGLRKDRRAISTGLVVSVFIVFVLCGALLPTAFSQVFNASTTGWSTSTVTVWVLLPLMGVIAIMISILPVGKS